MKPLLIILVLLTLPAAYIGGTYVPEGFAPLILFTKAQTALCHHIIHKGLDKLGTEGYREFFLRINPRVRVRDYAYVGLFLLGISVVLLALGKSEWKLLLPGLFVFILIQGSYDYGVAAAQTAINFKEGLAPRTIVSACEQHLTDRYLFNTGADLKGSWKDIAQRHGPIHPGNLFLGLVIIVLGIKYSIRARKRLYGW